MTHRQPINTWWSALTMLSEDRWSGTFAFIPRTPSHIGSGKTRYRALTTAYTCTISRLVHGAARRRGHCLKVLQRCKLQRLGSNQPTPRRQTQNARCVSVKSEGR